MLLSVIAGMREQYNVDRETALFTAFAVPSKQARYAELLRSRKGRVKLRKELDHFADLDLRYCTTVPPVEHTPSGLTTHLRRLGAPTTCYVFSSDDVIDGREFELEDALSRVLGRGYGTFLSCTPKLAYFEGEGRGQRYICKR